MTDFVLVGNKPSIRFIGVKGNDDILMKCQQPLVVQLKAILVILSEIAEKIRPRIHIRQGKAIQ
jgi:hypothetical protein